MPGGRQENGLDSAPEVSRWFFNPPCLERGWGWGGSVEAGCATIQQSASQVKLVCLIFLLRCESELDFLFSIFFFCFLLL